MKQQLQDSTNDEILAELGRRLQGAAVEREHPALPTPSATVPASVPDFVDVPSGPFLMGSDKEKDPTAYDDELPQHRVSVPRYFIGRHLVTVAQFRAYATATSTRPGDARTLAGPDDHPVTLVDWHEALAYCEWLTELLRTSKETPKALAAILGAKGAKGKGTPRYRVTLPSEAEWEKAARGGDGRLFPWGDAEPDDTRLNFNMRVGRTTPVGQYPQGASPYGCLDMAGNVWEWTRSLWDKYPYPEAGAKRDRREATASAESASPSPDGLRVVRGGSFYYDRRGVRCAARYAGHPHARRANIGFRVVASPF